MTRNLLYSRLSFVPSEKITRQQDFQCSTVLLHNVILPIRFLSFCLSVSVWNPLLVFIKACGVSDTQSYCQFPPLPMQWLQLPSLNKWQFKGPSMTESLCSQADMAIPLTRLSSHMRHNKECFSHCHWVGIMESRARMVLYCCVYNACLFLYLLEEIRLKSPHSYKA